jgi:DnaJ-class molecular chaperone
MNARNLETPLDPTECDDCDGQGAECHKCHGEGIVERLEGYEPGHYKSWNGDVPDYLD